MRTSALKGDGIESVFTAICATIYDYYDLPMAQQSEEV
jgi:hypothetical protein